MDLKDGYGFGGFKHFKIYCLISNLFEFIEELLDYQHTPISDT